MDAMRGHDLDWRRGRHGAYVWYDSAPLEEVLRDAYGMFMVENGLGIRVFPSIQRMEAEVLDIVAGLLSAPEGSAGIFTSGGTESIFLAMFALREWARATRPAIPRPCVVAPHSAHPALNKAAHYLGLDVIRVPVAEDFAADVLALEAAITPATVGLYASAPTYSLGIVDPVPALGALAGAYGLWLHVDACVGGILAPFVRRMGHDVPPFDFALDGVTSVSADLHKSGFLAKPASTVTFRTKELAAYARYRYEDWPSGSYVSSTFTGSRPGGAIAAAWAGMQYLGEDGYERIAAASMRTKAALIAGLSAIPGFRMHGAPPLWPFAFAVDGADPRKLAAGMFRLGFVAGTTTSPAGIHVMPTPVHEDYVDDYVQAVRAALADAPAADSSAAPRYAG
jgi:glutamate/tyrosine decarboxylase-like PLP-dependent enzyme